MKWCPKCGLDNSDESKICTRCKTDISQAQVEYDKSALGTALKAIGIIELLAGFLLMIYFLGDEEIAFAIACLLLGLTNGLLWLGFSSIVNYLHKMVNVQRKMCEKMFGYNELQ